MWNRLRSAARRRWIVIGLIFSVALFSVVWWVGGKLVTPKNHAVGPAPKTLPIQSVHLQSDSGDLVAGWYVVHPTADATVVLLHPIRADRRAMLGRAAVLYNAGYSSLLVDLQAHGETPGDAITFGYRERYDAQAAVAFARRKNPSHRIFVVGRSLGAAAALLGSPLPVDGMVIESVYPTIHEATHNRVAAKLGVASRVITPLLLMQLYPRLGIRPSELCPLEYIDEVQCPILIMSGDQDKHTTWSETQRLYEAAAEPKQLVSFRGAGHEDLLLFDPELYISELLGFFRRFP